MVSAKRHFLEPWAGDQLRAEVSSHQLPARQCHGELRQDPSSGPCIDFAEGPSQPRHALDACFCVKLGIYIYVGKVSLRIERSTARWNLPFLPGCAYHLAGVNTERDGYSAKRLLLSTFPRHEYSAERVRLSGCAYHLAWIQC